MYACNKVDTLSCDDISTELAIAGMTEAEGGFKEVPITVFPLVTYFVPCAILVNNDLVVTRNCLTRGHQGCIGITRYFARLCYEKVSLDILISKNLILTTDVQSAITLVLGSALDSCNNKDIQLVVTT